MGSTGDPFTALAGGQALAKRLDNAVLLTRDGPGHGAYLKNHCVDDAVNAYLVDLAVPAPNTRCPD